MSEIGVLIRLKRKERRMSQKELANASGLGISTIQGYEQGRHAPKYESVEKICAALDVEIGEFYGTSNLVKMENDDETELKHYFDALNARGRVVALDLLETLSKTEKYNNSTSAYTEEKTEA